jgi:uncharacterized protein (DUF2249 family)
MPPGSLSGRIGPTRNDTDHRAGPHLPAIGCEPERLHFSMTNENQHTEDVFDGRALPCEEKRPAFIDRCISLPVGRSFVFLNGHDPVPLRRHLDQLHPGCFGWEILGGASDDSVRLKVTKLAQPEGGFSPTAGKIDCH